MTEGEGPSGPLDTATLEAVARRAGTHSLVDSWAYQPDSLSPRFLELQLDAEQYPAAVNAARLDIRWFEGGDYTVHYLETRAESTRQCRWDRHPKPDEPRAHFHPPPDAAPTVEASELTDEHYLGVLFAVLEWVEARVTTCHESS